VAVGKGAQILVELDAVLDADRGKPSADVVDLVLVPAAIADILAVPAIIDLRDVVIDVEGLCIA
jgi:hypothetical protein